jgi:hypothetical protein
MPPQTATYEVKTWFQAFCAFIKCVNLLRYVEEKYGSIMSNVNEATRRGCTSTYKPLYLSIETVIHIK